LGEGAVSDATIVAIVILVGVFVLMSITILKYGAEGAARLWGIMGALTGVAFGGITSFYFTNKYNQQEIRQVKLEKKNTELVLYIATVKAGEANKYVSSIASVLESKRISPLVSPSSSIIFKPIPESEIINFTRWIEAASLELKDIEQLKPVFIVKDVMEGKERNKKQ